jgi:hypothetical protein
MIAAMIQTIQKRKLPESLGISFSTEKGTIKSKIKRKENQRTQIQNDRFMSASQKNPILLSSVTFQKKAALFRISSF